MCCGELAGFAGKLDVGCERTSLVFYMSNWVISREGSSQNH